MRYLSLIALLVLSACGGSTHYETPPPPTPPAPPVSMVDAFVTAVLAVIGDGAETTTEPQATDMVAATAPDDTEPVAVK